MTTSRWRTAVLVILSVAIGLSPSLTLGQLRAGLGFELRVEDFLLFFLLAASVVGAVLKRRSTMYTPPFIGLIALLTWWAGVTLLVNAQLGNVSPMLGSLYFLKEVQVFLLYVYVAHQIGRGASVRVIAGVWVAIGALHIAWIFVQMLLGLRITYYYSYTTFIEPEGTLPGAGFLLVILCFGINLFLYHFLRSSFPPVYKVALAVACASPIVGIITSGSRGALLGVGLALPVLAILYWWRTGSRILTTAFTAAGLGILLLLNLPVDVHVDHAAWIPDRLVDIEGWIGQLNAARDNTRADIWFTQLHELSQRPWLALFGGGKSILLVNEESHNYYIKLLNETGVVGLLIFLILIGQMLLRAMVGWRRTRDRYLQGLCAGFVTATVALLGVGMTAEVLQVVKIAEIYWFFAALTLTAINVSGEAQGPRAATAAPRRPRPRDLDPVPL